MTTMMDLSEATRETFAPLIGSHFALDAAPVERLELADAESRGSDPSAKREQFSLLFLGPATPILPQQIYRMTSDALGALELFIVPIGPDGTGRQRYEAAFT